MKYHVRIIIVGLVLQLGFALYLTLTHYFGDLPIHILLTAAALAFMLTKRYLSVVIITWVHFLYPILSSYLIYQRYAMISLFPIYIILALTHYLEKERIAKKAAKARLTMDVP